MPHAQPHPVDTIQTNLTLASLSAQHNATSDIHLGSTKIWLSPYGLDSEALYLSDYTFQSNAVDICSPAGSSLAGLGIRYPGHIRGPEQQSLSPSLVPTELCGSFMDSQYSRTPRLESNYTLDDTHAGTALYVGNTSNFGESNGRDSPWTFSSILKAANFAIACPSIAERAENVEPAKFGLKGMESKDSSFQDFSFEALSASAGMSVEDLAARFTAGAQYALRHLASDTSQPVDRVEFSDKTPEMVPFVADINMFNMNNAWLLPSIGVNPADVMPAPSVLSPIAMSPPRLPFDLPETQMDIDLTEVVTNWQHSVISVASQINTIISSETQKETNSETRSNPGFVRAEEHLGQMSDYDPAPFLSPSSSEYSPSFGTSRQHNTQHNSHGTRVRKRKIPICGTLESNADILVEPSSESQIHLLPVDLGTPVFDAHRGIHLHDLKARAERYRLRNQGRDYDKRWLLSFAGKLSAQGELVEEFKCYVIGCQQVNKRRDHILIHVGGHLDQRPFKCPHCPARFLRKNECKRHELSHTGLRPFACHLCLMPTTTFVRQDLLRRHLKRTHQIEVNKENKAIARPKKKARKQ